MIDKSLERRMINTIDITFSLQIIDKRIENIRANDRRQTDILLHYKRIYLEKTKI